MNGNHNGRNNDERNRLDFENSREIERIRQNEMIEREKRAKRIAHNKRMEMKRQARIKQLKDTISAWAMLLGGVAVIIAIICMLVSSCNKNNEEEKKKKESSVPETLMTAISDFNEFDGKVYSQNGDAVYSAANSVYTLSNQPADSTVQTTVMPSAFMWQARQYAAGGEREKLRTLKDTVRDFPQFSNGYIWSSAESMKYGFTESYLYDTNSRFISAICEICLWEANTAFLDEIDATGEARFDASRGKTVLEKLEAATAYFFDKNDLNGGGIRYNETDGLVYVLTEANSGLSDGAGSNYWYNHRFGYLDCYNNIAFNQAMVQLSRLYTLMGLPEKAQEYADIAAKNKEGINNTFWNSSLGRYIGAKDTSGKSHDLGFVFLNLEAVSEGIADKEKTKRILSWIDGERTINTDTSTGEDIYKNGYAPRSTTIAANDSWWDYVAGKCPLSGGFGFGEYYQNGGASPVVAALDIKARNAANDKSQVKKKVVALGEYITEISAAMLQRPENAVVAAEAVNSLFGLSTDGSRLYMSAHSIESEKYSGVKNVSFGTGIFGFLIGNNSVIVTSQYETPIRLEISGFEKNTECTVKIVRGDTVEITEKVTTNENGILSLSERFGGSTLLWITQPATEETKKK